MKDSFKQQKIQEDQYEFPYHYVPALEEGNFCLHVFWSWGLNYLSSTEFLLGLVAKQEFKSLIDIGCGDGRFLRELNRVFSGKTLTGVDYSKSAINIANALNPDLDFRCTDINDNNQLGCFDIVTSVEVIEHIPLGELDRFISSMATLQKPDGYLFLTVPHSNIGVQKKHFQHFTRDSLEKTLGKYYRIEEFFFFDKKSWQIRYLRGLLKNRFFILNWQPLLNWIYRFYKKKCFFCSEADCMRMGIIGRKL